MEPLKGVKQGASRESSASPMPRSDRKQIGNIAIFASRTTSLTDSIQSTQSDNINAFDTPSANSHRDSQPNGNESHSTSLNLFERTLSWRTLTKSRAKHHVSSDMTYINDFLRQQEQVREIARN